MAIYGVLDGERITNIIDISQRNAQTWATPLVPLGNSGAGIGCSYVDGVFYDEAGEPLQSVEDKYAEATEALRLLGLMEDEESEID